MHRLVHYFPRLAYKHLGLPEIGPTGQPRLF